VAGIVWQAPPEAGSTSATCPSAYCSSRGVADGAGSQQSKAPKAKRRNSKLKA
jgi:hypothetical protein